MVYGSSFLWNLAKDWQDTSKKISDANWLSIAGTLWANKDGIELIRNIQGAKYKLIFNASKNNAAASFTTEEIDVKKGRVFVKAFAPAGKLDLAFVIDSTSSMGPYINSAISSAASIFDQLAVSYPDYRVSIVDYKDWGQGDAYTARITTPFTKSTDAIVNGLLSIRPSGGGDIPEAVYTGVAVALAHPDTGGWRRGADVARQLIVFGDAPAKDPEPVTGLTASDIADLARSGAYFLPDAKGAASNPRILAATLPESVGFSTMPLGASSATASSFLNLARATGGNYFPAADPSVVANRLLTSIQAFVPPPTISSNLQLAGFVDTPFYFKVTATNSPRSFTSSALPDGLILNRDTGEITGTPKSIGGSSVTITVSNSSGTTSSQVQFSILANSRVTNISVRTTLSASQILIVGFTIAGGEKPMLLRAVGPGLTPLGVTGAMEDPTISLFGSSGKIAENDNWNGDTQVSNSSFSVGAFTLSDTSKDAALVRRLSGGYTAQASGAKEGNLIVEVYDTGSYQSGQLTNVSARNRVGTGGDILIAGFTIAGSKSKTLLVRGVGPTLGSFGVGGVLNDPKLEIYNSAGIKVAENDNWGPDVAAPATAVGAFKLSANSRDAALLINLPPGAYTVQVKGADGGVGEALVEIYDVPKT